MTNQYTLYGSPASLYTGKVRAYLNYKNIPYREQISSMRVYKNTIIPKTGVAMIPVVESPDGEFIQDTSVIIDTLEQAFPKRSIYPTGPKQALVALLFELYGDEWMRLPAMHYRWNFPEDNLEFIKHQFGSSVAPGMPKFVQKWLGKKVVAKFSGYVKPLGITPKTIPAIESWYEELLQQLNSHFEQHDFLLGSCPSIGDYGLMGPLYAHLYRDPYPGKLMKAKAPNVAAWVERMNDSQNISGEFLADDAIPSSLEPILARMFKEYWPTLETIVSKVADWGKDQAPGTQVPRALGMHAFELGGASDEQMTLSFSQWMLQRPLDFYAHLSDEDRASVDAFLTKVGGLEALQMKIPQRLKFENYKVVSA